MDLLVAGPYAGEFGWEMCAWVPRLRAMARDFKRVIVLAPASSAALYEFAELVPIEIKPGTSNFVHGELAAPAPPVPPADVRVQALSNLVLLELSALQRPEMRRALEAQKAWRVYGKPGPPLADVCLALRPPKLLHGTLDPLRAYPAELADELAMRLGTAGLRLASIGGAENQLASGSRDLRGAPLEQQMDVLASAQVAVGPSSGPLHLAHLCGCAVVTWFGAEHGSPHTIRQRYASAWNPHRAPLIYLEEREPSPERIAAAVLALCAQGEVRAG